MNALFLSEWETKLKENGKFSDPEN